MWEREHMYVQWMPIVISPDRTFINNKSHLSLTLHSIHLCLAIVSLLFFLSFHRARESVLCIYTHIFALTSDLVSAFLLFAAFFSHSLTTCRLWIARQTAGDFRGRSHQTSRFYLIIKKNSFFFSNNDKFFTKLLIFFSGIENLFSFCSNSHWINFFIWKDEEERNRGRERKKWLTHLATFPLTLYPHAFRFLNFFYDTHI